jgi:RNA polymerase sigma-70 factor (ECF subfamily)
VKARWDRDRDPLVALGQGRPALFEEFVRSEAGTLISFFQRLGGSRGEAEDLAQEVFLKLYRQAANYQPQGTFDAFALRIARNAWIDRRRRDAARISALPLSAPEESGRGALEPAAEQPEVGHRLIQAEERLRIRLALRRLSSNHAIIFDLAVVQALPYGQIADELDIPVGTVKSRVFHALRQLRAALESSDDPAADAPRAARRPAEQALRAHKPLGGTP